VTYPDGSYTTYEYDALSRLTKIKNQGGTTLRYLGTPYNGTKLRELWSKERFVYQRKHRDFQSNDALSQPRKRLNMLNLVPLGTPYPFLR